MIWLLLHIQIKAIQLFKESIASRWRIRIFLAYHCRLELHSYDQNSMLSVIQESSSQCLIRKNFPRKIHMNGLNPQLL